MKHVESPIARRTFLKATGAVAATTAMTARSYADTIGANDRLNIAVVGCGGISYPHLKALAALYPTENISIPVVCDVYEKRAKEFQAAVQKGNMGDAKIVHDYRDVLAMKDINYVLFCTPEHWHAKNILDALDAGKHVYCEKPMTHTIPEAQAVVAKTNSTGLKVQIGIQGMSDDSYISAYEAIKAGKIGRVVHAQIEYCRSYSKDEGPWRGRITSPDQPADLDWERWLGPAPKRPWSAPRYFEWRNYRDYSGGVGTDLFVHRIARIIKACGLTYPNTVAGFGGIYIWPDGRELPDNFQLAADYPAVEGITPGMTLHILGTMANRFRYDHAIRGENGTLLFGKKGWEIQAGKGQVVESFERTSGEDMVPHHKNHFDAIRKGTELNCPVELGLYSMLAVRMANLSWFNKQLLAWDAKRNKVISADKLVPWGKAVPLT